MGGVGGVGLVLVDPGGGAVVVIADVIGGAGHPIGPGVKLGHRGPGQCHEIGGTARHIQGVIRGQRDEHAALASLADQIEAMVEELAEDRHPGVERRRKTRIRSHVGHEQGAVGGDGGGRSSGSHGGGVGAALIADQVADTAHLAVEDDAGGLGVAAGAACGEGAGAIGVEGGRLARAPLLGQNIRHQPVGGTELLLAGDHVVVDALDGA